MQIDEFTVSDVPTQSLCVEAPNTQNKLDAELKRHGFISKRDIFTEDHYLERPLTRSIRRSKRLEKCSSYFLWWLCTTP